MRSPSTQPSAGHLAALVHAVLASAIIIAAPVVTAAQNVITLRADSARRTIAPSSKLAVPVILDMSAAGGTNLASLTTGVTFGASRLTFDSVKAAGFGTLTPTTTSAASGSLTLGVTDATGTTATQTLATMYFTASATAGGTTIAFSPTVAASAAGPSILALLRSRALDICVAPIGIWGDVNGDSLGTPLGDGAVNIIDAQQIARYSVGLTVSNRPGLVTRGDVTADGSVNIIDAQQIARFSVGLSAAARTNTNVYTPPTTASISLAPNTPQTVAVGGFARVTATPRDAANADLTGCASVTWSSSNAAVASVSTDGLVTGVADGTATITATSVANVGVTAVLTVTVTGGAGTGTHNASGTYTWSSGTSTLTLNTTTSDFACDGPSLGTETNTGVVITATTMTWPNDNMTWTRSSGTAGDIVGTWTSTDSTTGNSFTLTFNANGTASVVGNIVSCPSVGGGGSNGGNAAKAEAQHWSSGYLVQLRYSDQVMAASSVSVTGYGIPASGVALTYNPLMSSWGSGTTESIVQLGTTYPTGLLPLTYTFTITPVSGTPATATSTVSCFEQQFATNISPTGTVTGTPTFSWTGIADTGAVYGVQVNDSNGNWLWANYNISGTSIVYNGPALTAGMTYGYVVSVQSSSACNNPTSGGGSHVANSFTYGSGGGADTTAPSMPTRLAATPASSSQVNLTWTASTDNVGVTGYKVYRNTVGIGVSIGVVEVWRGSACCCLLRHDAGAVAGAVLVRSCARRPALGIVRSAPARVVVL